MSHQLALSCARGRLEFIAQIRPQPDRAATERRRDLNEQESEANRYEEQAEAHYEREESEEGSQDCQEGRRGGTGNSEIAVRSARVFVQSKPSVPNELEQDVPGLHSVMLAARAWGARSALS